MGVPALIKLLPLLSTITLGAAGQKGLIGYGISRNQPRCAYSCQSTLSTSDLACKITGKKTTPDCYATDDAFLESLAWCIHSRCPSLSLWQDEQWWAKIVSGDPAVQPKYSFAQALPTVEPKATVARKMPLKVVAKTRDHDYQIAWNTYAQSDQVETEGSTYAIVFICIGLLVPIGCSLLRFILTPKTLTAKASAYFIQPATWGTRHRTSISNIGICPTRGQSLFILLLFILNVIFSFTTYNYHLVAVTEQTRFRSRKQQLLATMASRLAVMCLVNLALLILYAGRNNFLLWITKWQRETFLLFYHWIGYMTVAGAVGHALIFLYLAVVGGRYPSEHTEPFWQFGTVAIVSFVLVVPLSILPVRVRVYEIFLTFHRLLAYLALVGVFIHVYLENKEKGLHNWMYAALAALGFDYMMRTLRIARNGVRRAKITIIDADYLRVDVSGIAAEGHVYVYFPTLTWRMWENHPFSVAASFHNGSSSSDATPARSGRTSLLKPTEKENPNPDIIQALTQSKEIVTTDAIPPIASIRVSAVVEKRSTIPTAGITFFIRRRNGLTSLLASRTQIPVLIESSYGSLSSLRTHPNLIAIAGGVGIVTVLPLLRIHPGRTKLYWGVRTNSLLDALADDLQGVDKEVFIGRRISVRDVLGKEICGDRGKGAVVVVSGPPGLADDVRAVVCEMGKVEGAWPVKLVDESFG